MPQMQLPIFPHGVTEITNELAFKKESGSVVYFNGQMPVFVHDELDIQTFRMITAQFCVNGNAKQTEIARAFGISVIGVKRAVKKYRESGPAGFYERPPTRGAPVLTPDVLARAQAGLDAGRNVKEIAENLGLKSDTLKKAVSDGRLKKKSSQGESQARSARRSQAQRASAA